MRTNQALKLQRYNAAMASLGSSNNSIYGGFEDLIKELKLEGKCLDFGAGVGNLARRLLILSCFSEITCIDLLEKPETIDKTINWIRWDLNEPVNLPDQSFDLIVSAEVIEHLENPREIVREWYRLLRPNGTLIFSTPNNESLRSLLALFFQGHFVAFSDSCYPAHITALLRKDIERILSEAGFSKPSYLFTNLGGIPKMPYITWQTVSFGLLKGLRYSDNLIVFAKKT